MLTIITYIYKNHNVYMKIAPWERVGKLYISFVNEQYEYMHETNGSVEVYTIVYMKIAPWERVGKLYISFVNEQYEYMHETNGSVEVCTCMRLMAV